MWSTTTSTRRRATDQFQPSVAAGPAARSRSPSTTDASLPERPERPARRRRPDELLHRHALQAYKDCFNGDDDVWIFEGRWRWQQPDSNCRSSRYPYGAAKENLVNRAESCPRGSRPAWRSPPSGRRSGHGPTRKLGAEDQDLGADRACVLAQADGGDLGVDERRPGHGGVVDPLGDAEHGVLEGDGGLALGGVGVLLVRAGRRRWPGSAASGSAGSRRPRSRARRRRGCPRRRGSAPRRSPTGRRRRGYGSPPPRSVSARPGPGTVQTLRPSGGRRRSPRRPSGRRSPRPPGRLSTRSETSGSSRGRMLGVGQDRDLRAEPGEGLRELDPGRPGAGRSATGRQARRGSRSSVVVVARLGEAGDCRGSAGREPVAITNLCA